MFLWTGLDQGCVRDHFRRARDLKMKENQRFYGFTDFRGKPERRGRWSRGTANQVTAGSILYGIQGDTQIAGGFPSHRPATTEK